MVSRPTVVLGEADGERAVGDLLLKQVLLVEEEDDGGLREPLVVADGVKQLHALVHAVLERDGGAWSLANYVQDVCDVVCITQNNGSCLKPFLYVSFSFTEKRIMFFDAFI